MKYLGNILKIVCYLPKIKLDSNNLLNLATYHEWTAYHFINT